MAYCVYCGTKILDGANFCTSCGAPVTKESENETTTQETETQATETQATDLGRPRRRPQTAPGPTQTRLLCEQEPSRRSQTSSGRPAF